MPDRYVKGLGAYLPLLRLDRKAAAREFSWSGLAMPRKGHRAVAGFDEDAVTLAVEAARLAIRGAAPDTVIFASTSAPFQERQLSVIAVEALGLPRATGAQDVSGSRRCAVSALARALRSPGDTLIAAGENRPTAPGSAAQLNWGDGAAAVLTGDTGCARLIGSASISADFIDLYRSSEHPLPYTAEERFVRDEAVALILRPALATACADAGIEPSRIALAAIHEPVSGCARALGLAAPNLCEEITDKAGDLGAAHALFGLALALERGKAGDIVLVAGFGSGCDMLLLEVTEAEISTGAEEALARGAVLASPSRFLSLAGSLDLDWGPRSELDPKIAATVLARHGRDMHGFVGGRDARGNVQFPKTAIPVSPDADGPEALVDVRLADETGRIVSITADRLNFTPDPPFHFGLVQFENGARVSMEFRDVEGAAPAVGDAVRMRFRIKAFDRKRGFRSYFWKAAPAVRPVLEGS